MDKEIKNLLKKTVKVAGVTCVAAGAVALMTTGAALKALTEGAKYLKDTVKKIVDEAPEAEVVVEEAAAAEEVTEAPVADEADFAEPESQEI